MLGSKATHFVVFLAVLGVASHVAVSVGEQPPVIIVFVHTEHSLWDSSAF